MKKKWLIMAGLFVLTLSFAAPMRAAECEDLSGDSRPCTAIEELDLCLAAVADAAEQRAASDRGTTVMRFLEFSFDSAVCAASAISPF